MCSKNGKLYPENNPNLEQNLGKNHPKNPKKHPEFCLIYLSGACLGWVACVGTCITVWRNTGAIKLMLLFYLCFFWWNSTSNLWTRGKSLFELWVTTFLPDWQPPLIFVWSTSKSHNISHTIRPRAQLHKTWRFK